MNWLQQAIIFLLGTNKNSNIEEPQNVDYSEQDFHDDIQAKADNVQSRLSSKIGS